MIRGFSVEDGTALFGLLADSAGDILLKTDGAGFICEASPSLESIGVRLSDLLVAPHLSDLSGIEHAQALREHCASVLKGSTLPGTFEFAAKRTEEDPLEERWFSLTLRPIAGPDGTAEAAIAVMRAIEPKRSLEDELLAASLIDQLTGLANRQAFMEMLSRFLAAGIAGSVIFLGIDRFRAITLRYGQSKADEVLWAFAQYLRTILGEDPILTRLDGERFAVILPDSNSIAALEVAEEAVATFAELSRDCGCEELPVTASAGVAAMLGEKDSILAAAELSLTLSQAAGGGKADLGGEVPILVERRRTA